MPLIKNGVNGSEKGKKCIKAMWKHHLQIGCYLILIALSCKHSPPTQTGFYDYLDGMYKEKDLLIHLEDLPDSLRSNYLFLDTRSQQEYQVSHLPHAEWVGFLHFQKDKLADLPKDQAIIVYCSVGYRSERIGKRLKKMGFSDVHNLYGGIFDWSNQQEPIVNQQGMPTDSIHTYNKKWGKWVFRGVKVY